MPILYNTMKESKNKNSLGVAYPDPFSFNINTFSPEKPVSTYALTEVSINRFDVFIYDVYGSSYYENIIILLNTITDIHTMRVGDIIYLWEASDLDKFIRDNMRLDL